MIEDVNRRAMNVRSPLVMCEVDSSYFSPEKQANKKTQQKDVLNDIQKFKKHPDMNLMDSSSKQQHKIEYLDEKKLEMSFAPYKRKVCTSEQDSSKSTEITAFQDDLLLKLPVKLAETPFWDATSLKKSKATMNGSSSFCRLLDESDYYSMDTYQSLPQAKEENESKTNLSKKFEKETKLLVSFIELFNHRDQQLLNLFTNDAIFEIVGEVKVFPLDVTIQALAQHFTAFVSKCGSYEFLYGKENENNLEWIVTTEGKLLSQTTIKAFQISAKINPDESDLKMSHVKLKIE